MIKIETEEQARAELARLRELQGTDLAIEVLAIIEDNQLRWTQGNWRMEVNGTETAVEEYHEDPLNPACTTAFCFAGWVGALRLVKWAADADRAHSPSPETIGDPERCDCTGVVCNKPKHMMAIEDYAARVLDLDDRAATALFNGENSLLALRAGVDAMIRGDNLVDAIRTVHDREAGDLDDDDEEEYA
jgi:hypothetical protein